MIKKRLFSLVLAAAMMGTAIPAGAVELTEEETPSILVVDEASAQDTTADAALAVSAEEDAQDPEAYRATHRVVHPEEENHANLDGIRMLAGKSVSSIYTNKTYTVPAGAAITHGLDVSKWSDTINWSKVAKAGTDFTIIRVGYTGYGNGKQVLDPKFERNITESAKAGVPAGVYIYSQATTAAEAREEANFCLNAVKNYRISLPIVMDVEFAEDSNGYTGRLYKAKLSKSAQTNVCLAFCETIEKAGYMPMIYANRSMLENNMNAGTISAKYPIWLANYTTSTSYSGDYAIWQYSETGSVNGIDYPVDCNFGLDLDKVMSGDDDNINNSLPSADNITLSETAKDVTLGDTFSLTASVTPSEMAGNLKWTSTKPSVATVSSSGEVKAVGVGTAEIKAVVGNTTAVCTVTVDPEQTELTELRATALGNVKATWSAANGAEKYYIYRSLIGKSGSFTRIASTSKTSYKDTSVDHGNTYYYRVKSVRTVDGKAYSSAVSATQSVVAGVGTISVTISANEAKLELGGQTALQASIAPADASEPIAWKTSDSRVATVDNGTITARGVGTAIITAVSDGCSAECVVTVTPKQTAIQTLKKVKAGSVSLSWKTSSGAERYYVYRSTTGENGSFHRVKSTTKTTLKEKNLTRGQQYYYRVTAIKTVDSVRYRSKASVIKSVHA